MTKPYKFTFTNEILTAAHKHCTNNYDEICSSKICGCFYCLEIFLPDKVDHWLEEGDGQSTALCYCGIDAVISGQSGYPINKKHFYQICITAGFRINASSTRNNYNYHNTEI